MPSTAYMGNPPADGIALATTPAGTWTLWRLPTLAAHGPWRNYKLCANGYVPHKGNYWLAYNVAERRMSENKDHDKLREYRPDVLDWVLEQFNKETV